MLILQIHKVCYNSKVKQMWLVMLVGYECIALKLACNVCIRSITSYRFVCLRQRQKERNTHRSVHSSILLICMGQTHWVLLCPPFEPNVIQMTGGFPQAEAGGPGVFMGQR